MFDRPLATGQTLEILGVEQEVEPQTIIERLKAQGRLPGIAERSRPVRPKIADDGDGRLQPFLVHVADNPAIDVAGARIAPEGEPDSQFLPVATLRVEPGIDDGNQPFGGGQRRVGVAPLP
jgi:hypothetical protein